MFRNLPADDEYDFRRTDQAKSVQRSLHEHFSALCSISVLREALLVLREELILLREAVFCYAKQFFATEEHYIALEEHFLLLTKLKMISAKQISASS